jgi:predicted acyltransferase
MIIVDDAGSFLPAMNHSPWDGVTVADFVMPFFLFIVGVALALAYKVHTSKARSCHYLLSPPTLTSRTS